MLRKSNCSRVIWSGCLSALLAVGAFSLQAQENKAAVAEKAASAAKSFAKETFVMERYHVRYRFEKDGTGTRDLTVRVKVQSEGGVERFGQLVLGYSSANERMELVYLKVHKPDGKIVEARQDAVQDLAIPVDRAAPEYSDYREKHITVPGLRPGDVLEYQARLHIDRSLAPGHFWGEYGFFTHPICLEERLELDVPISSGMTLKHDPKRVPVQTDKEGRRLYVWTSAQLKTNEDREKEAKEQSRQEKKPKAWEGPDVAFTTFQNWAEVGRWYADLEKERRQATPELRAKAEELVKGVSGDEARIQALYRFVSQTNRYVSLSFGTGRYQPHAAAQTFANQYGDCKDKHTLLAALLEAEGYRAHAALVHTSRKLDTALPSPSQFNHVITQVELGAQHLWMDTTAEVAPFRLLTANLRKKKALVVVQEGLSHVEETPLDPPFPTFERLKIEGTVGAKGDLSGRLAIQMRGDSEFLFRSFLRKVPEAQWREGIKLGLGKAIHLGELEDMDLSVKGADQMDEALDMASPFHSKSYVVIKDRALDLALPAQSMDLPVFAEDEDDRDPLHFGGESEHRFDVKLTFPSEIRVRAPLGMKVVRPFGEYQSTYRMEGQTLVAERQLVLKQREIPYDQRESWEAFRRAVLADQAQVLALETERAFGEVAGPDQKDPDALFNAALIAHRERKLKDAADLYTKVAALKADYRGVYDNLGRCYLGLREYEKAIDALRKHAAQQPYDQWVFYLIGSAQLSLGRDAEAIASLQKQIEIDPLHPQAHALLGRIYMDQRHWKEAAEELEKASAIDSKSAWPLVELGRAYLGLGDQDKAMATFERGLKLESSPLTWNNIAYQLSLKNIQLDRALQYSESAVSSVAAGLMNQTLEAKRMEQQRETSSLCNYWDTLGWIHYQRGDIEKAERYIRAAWELAYHGEVGDHLGQIMERKGRKDEAMHLYALSLLTARPEPETRGRLVRLAGGDKQADRLVERVKGELLQTRLVKLEVPAREDLSLECYLSFREGTGLEEVVFSAPSEQASSLTEAVRKATLPLRLPGDAKARVVRRGLISAKKGGSCTLLLFPADALSGDNEGLR
jgi:tetratricopeptide (TPR) repeat protein